MRNKKAFLFWKSLHESRKKEQLEWTMLEQLIRWNGVRHGDDVLLWGNSGDGDEACESVS